jgi:hypothetical protein
MIFSGNRAIIALQRRLRTSESKVTSKLMT